MEAAEQWEPDDARVSRPVLRERGAATAPRHSPFYPDRGRAAMVPRWRSAEVLLQTIIAAAARAHCLTLPEDIYNI
jgi:hypothetical protein